MKFLITSVYCVLILSNVDGCFSNVKQDISSKEVVGGGIPNNQDKTQPKIWNEMEFVASIEDVNVVINDITKTDLTNIYNSLSFGNWYDAPAYSSIKMNQLTLTYFENEATNNHVLGSPYFWIALWNGYEQCKHTNEDNNRLDATSIKNIFSTYTSNSNKEFITSILTFTGKSSKIEELKNETSAVSNFESLLLGGLENSIHRKLQACNIFVDSNTQEFDFKQDVPIQGELKTRAMSAIRGLTILKGSIDKKMIPTLTENVTNVRAAKTAQSNYLSKIDKLIKKLEVTFVVKNPYKIYTINIDDGDICTLVLTDEEFTPFKDKRQTNIWDVRLSIQVNTAPYEILDGLHSKLIDKIRGSIDDGLLSSLLQNARLSN